MPSTLPAASAVAGRGHAAVVVAAEGGGGRVGGTGRGDDQRAHSAASAVLLGAPRLGVLVRRLEEN